MLGDASSPQIAGSRLAIEEMLVIEYSRESQRQIWWKVNAVRGNAVSSIVVVRRPAALFSPDGDESSPHNDVCTRPLFRHWHYDFRGTTRKEHRVNRAKICVFVSLHPLTTHRHLHLYCVYIALKIYRSGLALQEIRHNYGRREYSIR